MCVAGLKTHMGCYDRGWNMASSKEMYQRAYALHYKQKKLVEALALYEQLVAEHPTSAEAGYARTQIGNIGALVEKKGEAALAPPPPRRVDPAAQPIPCTTLERFDEGQEVLGIVTAEAVMGMSFFTDLMAGARDIVGGRSGAVQSKLREARKHCLFELQSEARKLGADSVLGVRLDYSALGSKMVMLVASGTAVRAKRRDAPE